MAVDNKNDTNQQVRLSKLMANRGMCSRREADRYIEQGQVLVDGNVIDVLGTRVSPDADIQLKSRAKKNQRQQATILINKPVGYVSGQPEPGYKPAIDLVRPENQFRASAWEPEFNPRIFKGLAPAGRLDIDSRGLLVLTQDGRVARQLVGENSDIEKDYLVWFKGEVKPDTLERLRHGMELDGKPLKPAKVRQLNPSRLRIILKEGKKRQIRRMCEQVGLKVTGLTRVRIGQVKLGDLPPGQWRFLAENEKF
jgi:23S rRNA pseudouridine2604 synthase